MNGASGDGPRPVAPQGAATSEVQFRDLPEVKRPSGKAAYFGLGVGVAYFVSTMALWATSRVDRRSAFLALIVTLWCVLHPLRTHRPAAWPWYTALGAVTALALLALLIAAG